MSPIFHRRAARSALTLGLVAGAALVLSAWAPGVARPVTDTAPVALDRVLVAQADAAPAEAPVHYSSDQADKGEVQYTKYCVECHGDDLKGGLLGGAPLRGLAFEQKYFGGPAGALYEVMNTTMPPDSPGRYSPATYADLMAYILKRNGFKAGAELPSDIDALYNLTIEK